MKDCACPTAEELLYNGDIKCANDLDSYKACPSDCEVCKTCLVLIGCEDIYPNSINPLSGAAKFGLATVLISAVSVSTVLAMKFFQESSSRQNIGTKEQNLPAHLMEQQAIEMSKAHREHRQAVTGTEEHGVWLAPLS